MNKNDKELMEKELNHFAQKILIKIKEKYNDIMTQEQLAKLESLLTKNNIVIDLKNDKDMEFFSNQAGIFNASDYSYKYVPSAHGGRTKEDGLIHIYPDSETFLNNDKLPKETSEIIKDVKNNIIVHELFHYFIQPSKNSENEFSSFITEGLVQNEAELLSQELGLPIPKSNYGRNVVFVNNWLKMVKEILPELTEKQLKKMTFIYSINDIKEQSPEIESNYEQDKQFLEEIKNVIISATKDLGFNKDDQIKTIKHYLNMSTNEEIIKSLTDDFSQFGLEKEKYLPPEFYNKDDSTPHL